MTIDISYRDGLSFSVNIPEYSIKNAVPCILDDISTSVTITVSEERNEEA